MALILRRVPLVQAMGHAVTHISRLGTALLLSLGLVLTVSACGMHVQTNDPYTPAEGVNFDIGTVSVRNLMILSRTEGSGFLSATMVSDERDALIGVAGNVIKVDGTDGSPLEVALANPVALGNSVLVVLTNRPLTTVQSPDLAPGLTVKMVLTFSTAGEQTIIVPVVDSAAPEYATITPTPSATASS